MRFPHFAPWRALAATTVLASAVALVACNQDATESEATPATVALEKIATFTATDALGARLFDRGASEIPAFDPLSKRLFVVNAALKTVDVVNLANPASPVRIGQIDVSGLGDSVNSISIANGIVALAIEAPVKQDPGKVAFYRADADYTGFVAPLGSVTVGALPDMLVFTPDGKRVLVANEGEPNSYGQPDSIDPEGSVSIISVSNPAAPTVSTVSFAAFNGQEAELRDQGIRIFGPGASAAQDFEPEYIAISRDGKKAWVTLQENNALAIVDIATATVSKLVPLGYKDHFLAGNELDTSDNNGSNSIVTRPVFGMYQPDAIAAFESGGKTWLITANEGDVREYTGFVEVKRVSSGDITISPELNALCGGNCKDTTVLGRLNVTTTLGSSGGVYDELYAFGARSFSIWSADGALAFDSGADIETRTAAYFPANFNASNTNHTRDNRSDDKGPEPEGVAVGKIGRKTFAFIGLERIGGIMVYDVSAPTAPVFVQYINPRDFSKAVDSAEAGDLGPEGLVFVPAGKSPNGKPLLIVGNEISGTTAIYQLNLTF